MSNSMNFLGRLGRDCELKDVSSYKVCEFTVANKTGFGDKKVTNWFRCTIWGKRAEKIAQYLKKGQEVFIIGELSINKYEKDGLEKFSHDVKVSEIELVGGKKDSSGEKSNDEELPF